jgi:hypothetical protein
VGEGLAFVTGYYGVVVKVAQQPPAVGGENDLLLSTFDGGSKVQVIGFLEFLAGLHSGEYQSVA